MSSPATAAKSDAAAAAAYLSINNIEVIYDHVILVLKGVSLHVPEGKIVALLGANGAGKTTTLKAISNLLRAERGDVTKGTIEFMGKRVDQLTPNELVRMGVCQVMEGRHCFQHLTVEENLLTGAFTRSISRADLKRDLELVYTYFPRLKERRTSQSGYTSGGEQQMTAIGRALMARPKMILLDEPSMGLAPQLVEEIFEIVRDLNTKERVSFLLAEQNTMVALRFADYGYILENGRVVMDGAAKELAQNEDVKEFYLGLSTAGRKSFRDVKHYRRRKRWLVVTGHFDTLEIRDPELRERELLAQLPRQIAHAKAQRRRSHAFSPPSIRPRSRRAPRSRCCRSRASPNCSTCRRPSGHSAALPPRAGARRRACSPRPARSTSRKARAPTTGGSRERSSPRDFAVAISSTTAFPTTSRPPGR